jgi:hypothetical protein
MGSFPAEAQILLTQPLQPAQQEPNLLPGSSASSEYQPCFSVTQSIQQLAAETAGSCHHVTEQDVETARSNIFEGRIGETERYATVVLSVQEDFELER